MLEATRTMPVREFGQAPDVEYVTLRVDVTQGCLANPFTPPQDIDVLQFVAGSEPTLGVCTQPTEYQLLTVPSVIGLDRQAAIATLHGAGFNVAVVLEPPDQPDGIVIGQDPAAGDRLIQTGTVTITVAKGEPEPSPSPDPEIVTVPNVVGMGQAGATAALTQAGLGVSVSFAQVCDPADPACDYQQGVVWAQSPDGGAEVEAGTTVTIFVNP